MNVPGKWTLHLDQSGHKPSWKVYTPGGELVEVLSCNLLRGGEGNRFLDVVELHLDPSKFVMVKGDKIHEY